MWVTQLLQLFDIKGNMRRSYSLLKYRTKKRQKKIILSEVDTLVVFLNMQPNERSKWHVFTIEWYVETENT